MTGKGRRSAEITLRKLRWAGIFKSVVTGEDVIRQKPNPEGVLLVAKRLQVRPAECIYVGDMPVDIEAGRAAGMITIAAGWHGYFEQQLRMTIPDYWAEHPADIVEVCSIAGKDT
jgi:beta-phosphoglucomutase-like phosphatase (HAD superfamily)